MAVGKKTVETVQHRFPTQVLPMLFHALDESPGLFTSVFLQNYIFLIALTKKNEELDFEERLFSFKHQVILSIEKKQRYIQ